MATSKIFNGHFQGGLEDFNIPHVKMVLTSPPYFNARNYNNLPVFNNEYVWATWCANAINLLSAYADVVWWNTGAGYKDFKQLPSIYIMVSECAKNGIYVIDDIPWIKKTAPPKNIKNRPYPAWEHNFIFSRNPEQVEFYRDNVRRPYSPATISRMRYKLGRLSPDLDGDYGETKLKKVEPHPDGATSPNYLILPQDYTKRPHPAPMSPSLANWAIRAYTQEGDTVLDPMMGIGTTWIECEKLNRNFVGIELYKEYISIAKLSMHRLKEGKDPYNGLITEWRELHEDNKTDN